MPPRRKAPAGPPRLTDADVAGLRARVQAGEKPRVIVRAASAAVPAGTRGNVIRIGNPSDGEFIVVRLGRDEVPFAPAELALSARNGRVVAAAAASKSSRAASASRPAAKKSAPTKRSAAKATTGKKSVPAAKTASAPAATSPPAAKSAAATPSRSKAGSSAAKAAGASTTAAATRRITPTKAARKTAGRPGAGRSRRSLPPLVVTLRFDDGNWTVEAARGTRRLAKASSVRPGAVKAFADLVDESVVREALTETVESCRSVVEERAAALRAELHAAEAALKEYEARRR